ncbi:MAG: hypothetical protein D6731_04750 [Planctomycetota bacterium]|nr:MAG: hypothetical protein D6731_04750 [Planctomycetota bacterium]
MREPAPLPAHRVASRGLLGAVLGGLGGGVALLCWLLLAAPGNTAIGGAWEFAVVAFVVLAVLGVWSGLAALTVELGVRLPWPWRLFAPPVVASTAFLACAAAAFWAEGLARGRSMVEVLDEFLRFVARMGRDADGFSLVAGCVGLPFLAWTLPALVERSAGRRWPSLWHPLAGAGGGLAAFLFLVAVERYVSDWGSLLVLFLLAPAGACGGLGLVPRVEERLRARWRRRRGLDPPALGPSAPAGSAPTPDGLEDPPGEDEGPAPEA